MIDLEKLQPGIRELDDITDVIHDKEWLKTSPNFELYYMYRDLAENALDKMKIEDAGLRYDITLMLPVMLGKEFNKTLGHDHPIVPGTNLTYPELYEVLEGEAVFLLQDSDDKEIKDVFVIHAKKGEKALMLPKYEHVLINPTDKKLKTCNWICRNFGSNIYKPFRARHGFCYYAMKNPSAPLGIKWIKNENYESIPELRFEEANNFYAFDLDKNKPIYESINQPKKLDFLINPQNYEWK